MAAAPLKRAGQTGKSIEEVVTYSVNHPIRVAILVLLNEGRNYNHREIAEILDEPMNKLGNHLRELVDAGAVEIAEIDRHRNFTRHVYRAVETSYHSDEEMAAMTPDERQMDYGLSIQHLMAEMLASFRAGKISDDPQAWVASNWLNLDAQGRQDIADEQERSWRRLEEIEAESLNRAALSGEKTVSYVVAELGFERARTAPRAPRSADDVRGTSPD
jgi:DNA-binding transcriptional ArsR family regulator